MEPTIDELKQHYKKFSDDEIIQIFKRDAAQLRPEALEILENEVKGRGLKVDLEAAKQAQAPTTNNEVVFTDDLLFSYCDIVQGLHCPVCGGTEHPLNGAMTYTVMSFVLMTHYKKKLVIACPSCLTSELNKAMAISSVIGWWGFPWGIIRTIQSIYENGKMYKFTKEQGPNIYLKSYVYQQKVSLSHHIDNKDTLQKMIDLR